jgi:hypothetical protein
MFLHLPSGIRALHIGDYSSGIGRCRGQELDLGIWLPIPPHPFCLLVIRPNEPSQIHCTRNWNPPQRRMSVNDAPRIPAGGSSAIHLPQVFRSLPVEKFQELKSSDGCLSVLGFL